MFHLIDVVTSILVGGLLIFFGPPALFVAIATLINKRGKLSTTEPSETPPVLPKMPKPKTTKVAMIQEIDTLLMAGNLYPDSADMQQLEEDPLAVTDNLPGKVDMAEAADPAVQQTIVTATQQRTPKAQGKAKKSASTSKKTNGKGKPSQSKTKGGGKTSSPRTGSYIEALTQSIRDAANNCDLNEQATKAGKSIDS